MESLPCLSMRGTTAQRDDDVEIVWPAHDNDIILLTAGTWSQRVRGMPVFACGGWRMDCCPLSRSSSSLSTITPSRALQWTRVARCWLPALKTGRSLFGMLHLNLYPSHVKCLRTRLPHWGTATAELYCGYAYVLYMTCSALLYVFMSQVGDGLIVGGL